MCAYQPDSSFAFYKWYVYHLLGCMRGVHCPTCVWAWRTSVLLGNDGWIINLEGLQSFIGGNDIEGSVGEVPGVVYTVESITGLGTSDKTDKKTKASGEEWLRYIYAEEIKVPSMSFISVVESLQVFPSAVQSRVEGWSKAKAKRNSSRGISYLSNKGPVRK